MSVSVTVLLALEVTRVHRPSVGNAHFPALLPVYIPQRAQPGDTLTTEQPHPASRQPYSDLQATRIEYARQELEAARAADLVGLDSAGLVLLVERLRTRLDDMLQLIDEIGAG